MPASRIHPVILSGGSGTRLWPMSRSSYPKQLMALVTERTLLQETAARVADAARFAPPLLVCNEEHRFLAGEQLRAIGVTPRAIVLEPEGRNTAPAAALAAFLLLADAPDAMMLVLPSDHYIADGDGFRAAVAQAAPAAAQGALVTFGIAPRSPETGYGYIRRGAALDGVPGCFRVARFVEKPDLATAQSYLREGGYSWNSGMFLFKAARLVEELRRHAPAVAAAVQRAVVEAKHDSDFVRPAKAAFAAAQSISLDHAVMEKTDRAAVLPVDIGWTDVGSWAALWEVSAKDGQGNTLIGDVAAHEASGCYVRAGGGRLVTVVGLADAVVIDTDDALLVAARDRSQDVRHVVDRLKAAGRSETELPHRVTRPWGTYEGIDLSDCHQVKHIMVRPGGRLSLQKHARRAEHWIVVQGRARVTRNEEVFELGANQATFIPLGAVHRLENLADEPLHLIEVQCGDYLGEDDIVRLEDTYGRA